MTSVQDDFTVRIRCADYLRGIVTVNYGLQKPLGPRALVAGVRMSYEGQYSLEFVSQVAWPDGGNYEAAVRKGILLALEEKGKHSLGGKFTLVDVAFDPVHSCETAFCVAAREAAASILRLLRGHDSG